MHSQTYICVWPDPTSLETVWLNDVTTRFQTDKRTLGDTDLPHQLTFHLRRESDDLTLNLRRNYDIDPNADIYFVEQLKDGRSILKKENILEKEDVAYYQDKENGAYMTVRCVRRSTHDCDRVINGNIQLGSRSYDLQPDETIEASGDIVDVPHPRRKRYTLRDQTHIQHSDQTKDEDNSNQIDVAMELKDHLQTNTGQNKHGYLHDRWATARNDHNERSNDGKTRQLKKNYHVKVAVLIDSGVWDTYSSRVNIPDPISKRDTIQRLIREEYSHIMNGVNLRYKSVEDESISISVILQRFIYFQLEALFPHQHSRVLKVQGKKYIDVHNYLYDLSQWVNTTGANYVPAFDHAMLFTT
ncbi:hypothetical protein ACJMK2_004327 [Sinanodonta woodiana]|uniref:Uncharacterized protein n=1 Tax=Sinanodonta woodiana TaxID=1069815 RepID=A0ABD3Y363_SINWO